eukprot:CAMPEP_0197638916 /NCGR_PEP_ID=MMETSP1338-20131121/13699_1 /TAXON_ID=43686 ORGANISM="Pelagodinium beii, Strain RCC1491" /NCGR_SAMPLE_ID=MMETSP1338 /ASSEMBLY_ACC=CAM_ASM_000754 /LENGTH=57 /DNA_ID=CAMNT_0043211577 /DNA_START=267 /DNA_END=437 /DNA_ORIENTATION=+
MAPAAVFPPPARSENLFRADRAPARSKLMLQEGFFGERMSSASASAPPPARPPPATP